MASTKSSSAQRRFGRRPRLVGAISEATLGVYVERTGPGRYSSRAWPEPQGFSATTGRVRREVCVDEHSRLVAVPHPLLKDAHRDADGRRAGAEDVAQRVKGDAGLPAT